MKNVLFFACLGHAVFLRKLTSPETNNGKRNIENKREPVQIIIGTNGTVRLKTRTVMITVIKRTFINVWEMKLIFRDTLLCYSKPLYAKNNSKYVSVSAESLN